MKLNSTLLRIGVLGVTLLALACCFGSAARAESDAGALPDTELATRGGFSADTRLAIYLSSNSFARVEWIMGHNLQAIIPGAVLLENGGGTEGGTNKIMLYGDRTDPLLNGESDWSMSPRPMNLYFAYTDTSQDVDFPFGPACAKPGPPHIWTQTYLYTACCNRINTTPATTSASVDVISAAQ